MQKVVKEMVEALGVGLAFEIVERWGGRQLRVPRSIEREDPLALTLGFAAAKKVVEAFGGELLQLPIEKNALLDMRNRAIVRDYVERGRSLFDIAHDYGLTRQAAMRIIKAAGQTEGEAA